MPTSHAVRVCPLSASVGPGLGPTRLLRDPGEVAGYAGVAAVAGLSSAGPEQLVGLVVDLHVVAAVDVLALFAVVVVGAPAYDAFQNPVLGVFSWSRGEGEKKRQELTCV